MRPLASLCSFFRKCVQIFRALHFKQARRCAVKLEGFHTLLCFIELFRLRFGGDEQPRMMIIKHVDQQNEALGLIAA